MDAVDFLRPSSLISWRELKKLQEYLEISRSWFNHPCKSSSSLRNYSCTFISSTMSYYLVTASSTIPICYCTVMRSSLHELSPLSLVQALPEPSLKYVRLYTGHVPVRTFALSCPSLVCTVSTDTRAMPTECCQGRKQAPREMRFVLTPCTFPERLMTWYREL